MQFQLMHQSLCSLRSITNKMKSVILFTLALVAVVVAVPVDQEPIKTLRSDFETQPDGAYVFNFETENGIFRTETGEVKEVLDAENKPHNVVVVRGSYSYPGPDGKPETVNYSANEYGYVAEGESIPKAA